MSLAGIGTAQAKGGHDGGCGNVGIKHSVDGGQTWTTDGRINGDTPPTTIQVKLSSKPGKGCSYTVSLASYSAEGPDWDSSGHQDFRGWDTVTLSKGKTKATLDVSQYAPQCFGQIDLYGNGTQYDGGTGEGHGALPHFPDSATPTDLITAWNGGHKCDDTTPTPTPTDTPTPSDTPTTGTPTPSDTPTTGTPTPSDTPTTTTPTPSDTPTTATPTPSDTPTTTPAVGDTSSPSPSTGSTAPPTGTPSVPPASGGDLAETGGNGTQTLAFAAGGAVLLLAGGGAVYFTRRRHSGAH
jgi:LPXTG-motif cell wall-anchored protein